MKCNRLRKHHTPSFKTQQCQKYPGVKRGEGDCQKIIAWRIAFPCTGTYPGQLPQVHAGVAIFHITWSSAHKLIGPEEATAPEADQNTVIQLPAGGAAQFLQPNAKWNCKCSHSKSRRNVPWNVMKDKVFPFFYSLSICHGVFNLLMEIVLSKERIQF